MCGLTGFWDYKERLDAPLEAVASAMSEPICHRGPDDEGHWVAPEARLAFGFRRLAILELSPLGHQPMHSPDGRYTLTFNGEIYNFQSLRQTLEGKGHQFEGRSDTEVMLGAFAEWGVEESVRRFRGMFAFAVWDAAERALSLARDRMGEKPMYYGVHEDVFLFGSELKSLRRHPAFDADVDRDALGLFLRHGYVPGPHSIYQGIRKLRPGTLLRLSEEDARRAAVPEPTLYWSLREVAQSGQQAPFEGDDEAAIDGTERRIREAVGRQMVADVPLGAFLSGGIDSSTIVALMQAESDRSVKTFTIGFHDPDYNEAGHAKAIAEHLGTDHTELYLSAEEARAVIPRLPTLYDEPFADPSQIPTFLVSRLARQDVTVSLSGDGGDELFGGYERYFRGLNHWRRLEQVPLPVRRSIGAVLGSPSRETWEAGARLLRPLVSDGWKHRMSGDFVRRMAGTVGARRPAAMYHDLVSHWSHPAELVRGGCEHGTPFTNPAHDLAALDPLQEMMYLDAQTYLPDDILVKVDRAAMGVSLETRIPLLDPEVMEWAWSLPRSMKVRNGTGKWALRQVLYRHVPRELVERPKMGFGVPIGEWLRGPLHEWADELLDRDRLHAEGYLHPEPIRRCWRQHERGEQDWSFRLWNVLMFQAWLEEWGDVS